MVAGVENFSALKALPGTGVEWLSGEQEKVWKEWEKLSFPNFKSEEWKYTSLRSLKSQNWNYSKGHESAKDIEGFGVQVSNGVFLEESIKLPDGVKVLSFSELDTAKKDFVSERLSRDLSTSNYFTALNAATSKYLFLEVGKDVAVDELFYIINDSNLSEDEYCSSRLFLWLNEGASLRVLETSDQKKSQGIASFVLDAQLEASSKLLRYDIKGACSDLSFSKCVVDCASSATYEEYSFFTGSKVERKDTVVRLLESSSHAGLKSVYLGDQSDHMDYQSEIHHLCKDATSEQHVKGVLKDKSRFVFNGKIFVAKGASGTDSSQLNSNLLLGEDVEVDTKPTLLIDNDDVKCSHGATVSRLNDDQLFYFQSRGIRKEVAEEMLALAFVEEVAFSIEDEAVRNMLVSAIEKRWREG